MTLQENSSKNGTRTNKYGSLTSNVKERYPLPIGYENEKYYTHPKHDNYKASHSGVYFLSGVLLKSLTLHPKQSGYESLICSDFNKGVHRLNYECFYGVGKCSNADVITDANY